jgi:pyridoxamine 5'-phosphate oxidase
VVVEDPIARLQEWLDEAGSLVGAPHAMALATSTPDGKPSARVVLLRGIDPRGLVFFTNRESRKGRELRANPHAAAVLHWWELGRQARVEGTVEQVSEDESAAYWETRPRGSQLAAWASPQSEALTDRAELDRRVAEARDRFDGGPVPLPHFWGGYRLVTETIELWTHRDDRLHDRVRFERDGDGWRRSLLAP